jgi:hypothetical protein
MCVTPPANDVGDCFLAHVVLPDGSTVGQHATKSIALAYSGNKMVPLLRISETGVQVTGLFARSGYLWRVEDTRRR